MGGANLKCCDVNAGMLRKRISVERLTKTPDGGGGWAVGWAELYKAWAHIKPLSGTESMVAMQLEDAITHDIVIRYRGDITAKDRIVYAGRLFNIISIINPEERDKWLQMRCEEGTAQVEGT